jgi:hypothetical protein
VNIKALQNAVLVQNVNMRGDMGSAANERFWWSERKI